MRSRRAGPSQDQRPRGLRQGATFLNWPYVNKVKLTLSLTNVHLSLSMHEIGSVALRARPPSGTGEGAVTGHGADRHRMIDLVEAANSVPPRTWL